MVKVQPVGLRDIVCANPFMRLFTFVEGLMHFTQCNKKYKRVWSLPSSHVYPFMHYDETKLPAAFGELSFPRFVPRSANNDLLQHSPPPSALSEILHPSSAGHSSLCTAYPSSIGQA